MRPISEPIIGTLHHCPHCDGVLAATDYGGEPPILSLVEPMAVMDAVRAWERIATARGIMAEQIGCSPDEALRALKELADTNGAAIGAFADGVIDTATLEL